MSQESGCVQFSRDSASDEATSPQLGPDLSPQAQTASFSLIPLDPYSDILILVLSNITI